MKAATADQLKEFLSCWPDVDSETGLSLRGDELLVKSREAMIAAVNNFNSASLHFRAEIFITTAMIGWTYLCHAWFKRDGIDYRYKTHPGDFVANANVGGKVGLHLGLLLLSGWSNCVDARRHEFRHGKIRGAAACGARFR